ncbi:AcrR family transcriptional regulator [Prosthecobacter fusiformis]|uniref:AcrR family transcriptional regulator n=1 Tax=Prosthecobacter fusiformis TaxID=48464 RepID=A0A4R7SQT3_9BACT|nr:TetR/AcrR family transcriptional regulator [Prosthecobacter fusiformis]TDU80969.1 AcrR family transcriptional regulator [Prosthecobacter fusiformis]
MDEHSHELPPLRQRIEEAYLHEFRAEGRPPVSVYRLCQGLGITEREFFGEYSSLEAVERQWWRGVMDKVIHSVESGPEWQEFSARQRMLAFMFGFAEASLDHRSLLFLRLGQVMPIKPVPEWTALEERYEEFVNGILMHGRNRGEIMARGPLSSTYPKVLRLLLRSVVAFHLKDDSPKFERTDAFIEKSVTVLFDLMGRQALDSGFDLMRFLLPGGLKRA